MQHMKYTRSFLKWAGGKYNCLPRIIQLLPQHAKRLIEPFAGGGSVFINTNYPEYLIAELNPDLIGLYQCLQTEGLPFINYCESYFCEANNTNARYYHFRTVFNETTDIRERAALFVYLNRHGYNGLCRYNQQGYFNVPFGQYTKPLFPQDRLDFFHQKSKNAQFKLGDFQETFALAEKGDVIYCDPPYAPIDQISNFTSYTRHEFGESEQIRLAELSVEAAQRGITVIISNHDTTFTRHHYRDAELISFNVPRLISRDIHNRKPVRELLAVFK